jgi:hypothetical protein
MSWSAAFIQALEQDVYTPIYRLRTRLIESEPNGGEWIVSSAEGYGENEVLLGEGGPRIQGSRVVPGSWSSTIGQFTVPLAGDVTALLRRVTRGTVVVLDMGFAGWPISDFEVIAVGQVWTVEGADPSWTLVCRDMLSMLRSRLAGAVTTLPMFYGLTNATTLTSAYTAGDATLNVSNTTGFHRRTGSSYGLKILPDGGGEAFYLFSTGSTGTTFTGTTDGGLVAWDETTETYVSSDANADTASIVSEVAYLAGHPLDIVRWLLLSTGAGTNGAYDTLPTSWSWGIPQDLVDIEDIQGVRTYVVTVSSGSYTWQVLVDPADAPLEDPYGWISALLADAGMYLTTRMGLLTVRAGQLHTSSTASAWMADEEILDEDIETARFLGLWDPQASTEYASIIAVTATGSTTTYDDLQTLPAAASATYDVSDRVFANEAAVRSEMTGRLIESTCRIGESIELVLRGIAWGRLTPGDVPRVTTPRLRGRLDTTRDGYDARVVYITSVSSDHQRNQTIVTALAYPTNDEVFGG